MATPPEATPLEQTAPGALMDPILISVIVIIIVILMLVCLMVRRRRHSAVGALKRSSDTTEEEVTTSTEEVYVTRSSSSGTRVESRISRATYNGVDSTMTRYTADGVESTMSRSSTDGVESTISRSTADGVESTISRSTTGGLESPISRVTATKVESVMTRSDNNGVETMSKAPQRPVSISSEAEERRLFKEAEEKTVTVGKRKVMFAQMERSNTLYELLKSAPVEQVASQVNSLVEVSGVFHIAGLEDCNLIFGIDYTGSNYLQGKKTFGRKCLHDISADCLNPYQSVISCLGETLEPFDKDGAIPAFGFGDAYTKDHSVFSLKPNAIPIGFKEVLEIYNQITPKVRLGGPTNFAPLIRTAIDIVKATKSYHILVIVADGQVTNERATTEAIVEASNYPLSIITVGVGDGPWDTMQEFDDKLPVRKFDNFHFVDYAEVTSNADNPNAAFALQALKEIPEQYQAIKQMELL